MILKSLKVLDIQRLGDTNEGIEAGISNESLPFVFEILSTKFYSNPIGSIIREITSNCFDSHAEANIDEPIIIRKAYDEEEGYSIEFQDFGVGLSVERMYGVYMNYFSSTKRDTNDLIGGFGLGSKTPLSHADYFYITTVFNGYRYEYLYHKGEKMPTLESLAGYSDEEFIIGDKVMKMPIGTPTEDRNGTTIKIIVESSDVRNFETELAAQLSYFDSVYFEGWRCSNSYDIYEGQHFKFRSDIDQHNTDIHLCMGKVRYNIDFNLVNIPRDKRKIPVGIKFEIGELEITPNRESVRYSKESIALIQERVEAVLNELTEMYNNQNPEIETLEDYNRCLGEEVTIVFNKEKGHKIDLWSYSGLSKNFKFKPISGIGLKKSPAQLFFNWEILGDINYNEAFSPRGYNTSVSNTNIIGGKYILMDKETKFSKYTDINIYRQLGSVMILRKKKLDLALMDRNLFLQESKKQEGKARLIYNYNKIIKDIVKSRSIGNYSDFRPTDEWIANYKKEQKELSLAHQRKLKKTVFVRNISNYGRGTDIKVYELERRTGILVYGFKEDKSKLENIHKIVTENVDTIYKLNYGRVDRAFMVLQISRATEISIVGAKKTIYWEDFIKTKFFNNICSAMWLKDMVDKTDIGTNRSLKYSLIPEYNEDMIKYNNLLSRYNKSGYSCSYKNIIDEDKIKVNPIMVKMFHYLKNKYDNVKIPFQNTISNIPNDEEDKKEYIAYIKNKKLRILNKYYLKDENQLRYESGVRYILDIISGKAKSQLLLTINQNQNGNEDSDNQEDCNSSEDDN